VLGRLEAKELAQAAALHPSLSGFVGCCTLWQPLFLARWGPLSPLLERSAKAAGSWKRFYKDKHELLAGSGGWERPCEWEMRALLELLAERAVASAAPIRKALVPASASGSGSPHGPLSASSALSPTTSRAPSLSRSSINSSVSTATACGRASDSGSQDSGAGSSSMSMCMSPPRALPVLAEESEAGAGAPAARGVQVVYLLDGSGSVSEDDFREMCTFVKTSAPQLSALLGVDAQVGVVQFSTEPRVERALGPVGDDPVALATLLDSIVRINGGTNISAAIARAGALMRARDLEVLGILAPPEPPTGPQAPAVVPGMMIVDAGGMHMVMMDAQDESGIDSDEDSDDDHQGMLAWQMALAHAHAGMVPVIPSPLPHALTASASAPWHGGAGNNDDGGSVPPLRIVLLLTDGRIDAYQAKEARATAQRLQDELVGCTLAALGVGRGVDRAELRHIITGSHDGLPWHDRYLDLFTRDDAPW